MADKKINILVADDDPAIRLLVADAFNTPEFHVLQAQDGVEVLKLIDAHSQGIDVLLIDVVMPRLNGAELARIILSRHPEIKIIFMSGHPDDVIGHYGIPESKMRYIKKPFTFDILEQAIRDELKRRN